MVSSQNHPYLNLPAQAFWRTGVAEPGASGITSVWQPKWPVRPDDVIATAGSCFAQHIGRAMAARGFGWTDFEPPPPLLKQEAARRFGYGVFSFRTGNIYTPRMLNQWLDVALEGAEGPAPVKVNGACVVDPIRPRIEPDGFATKAECIAARRATAAAIKRAVRSADIFVFTLGLTECWRDRKTGFEFASCPGTFAGTFDPKRHIFHNMRFGEVHQELLRAIDRMRQVNWKLRVLLTVSPVPLTATASGQHVMTATSSSKAILRSVAGELCMDRPEVDYFPSYELVTATPFAAKAFAKNMRSVTPQTVERVMGHFFAAQGAVVPAGSVAVPKEHGADSDDVTCEEVMLDAFAK